MGGKGSKMGLSSMEWSTGFRIIAPTALRTVHLHECEHPMIGACIRSGRGKL